ncbi:MAG: radical SAM protein, partial [Deltaproteobacteria bacterium]|nr:radical SAM protein [Deltaproteobacteria bacterium]
PDDVDYFSFSLDGATRQTNDMIRGKGCYDKCIAGIRKAITRGFHTSLIYTVSADNILELDLMASLLEDLGINRFFIQVIGIRGKSAKRGREGLQVSRSEWLKIIPVVAQKIARLGITVIYPKVYLSLDEPFECAGLVAENYFIFPNGRVYRCPLCEEGCVMNKLIQPDNLSYQNDGTPEYKVACCMLKEEVRG